MGKRYAWVALGALVIVTVAAVVAMLALRADGEPSTVVRPPVATPMTTSTPAPTPTVAPATAVTPAPTVTSAVSPSPTPTPTASPTPTPEPGGPVLPYNS